MLAPSVGYSFWNHKTTGVIKLASQWFGHFGTIVPFSCADTMVVTVMYACLISNTYVCRVVVRSQSAVCVCFSVNSIQTCVHDVHADECMSTPKMWFYSSTFISLTTLLRVCVRSRLVHTIAPLGGELVVSESGRIISTWHT